MSIESLTHLILTYRYWVLIPLTFIEGPIVAFVSGTLASLGYFNIYVLALIFFFRDLILDCTMYAVGYFGGRTAFAMRMLKKIGVTEDHLGNVKELWERRPARTMLLGKISYGVSAAFIVVAGTVRMNLRKFVMYGSLVAVLQYGVLLTLGYFFGVSLGSSIEKILSNILYLLGGAGVIISIYYIFSFYMRRRFMANERQIEEMKPEE
jgi:membrane protein DedA with SNARE-associated domain